MYEIAYLTKILLVQFILQLKNWLTTVRIRKLQFRCQNAYFKCVFMTKLFIKSSCGKKLYKNDFRIITNLSIF